MKTKYYPRVKEKFVIEVTRSELMDIIGLFSHVKDTQGLNEYEEELLESLEGLLAEGTSEDRASV